MWNGKAMARDGPSDRLLTPFFFLSTVPEIVLSFWPHRFRCDLHDATEMQLS